MDVGQYADHVRMLRSINVDSMLALLQRHLDCAMDGMQWQSPSLNCDELGLSVNKKLETNNYNFCINNEILELIKK